MCTGKALSESTVSMRIGLKTALSKYGQIEQEENGNVDYLLNDIEELTDLF